MRKVHADFGYPSPDTYHLLVSLLCYGILGNVGEVSSCLLALCSFSGVIMSSQTHDTFVYWMMGLVIVWLISHELFGIFSPVTLYQGHHASRAY
jgi:hypothetical protein